MMERLEVQPNARSQPSFPAAVLYTPHVSELRFRPADVTDASVEVPDEKPVIRQKDPTRQVLGQLRDRNPGVN
jgi:hypothetical protein